MPTLLLCLILLPFFIRISGTPNDNFRASDGVEDVRAQLRRVWSEFVRHHSTIRYKPLETGVQVRYIVFYKSSMQRSIAPRQAVCINRQPPEGIGADTCEKQRNAGHCKARLSGILTVKDGLCARTCGLCEIRNFGMRTTFEFITNKTRTKGKRKGQKIHDLVTLEMQSTGHWRFYKTHSDTLGTGVQCQSNRFVPPAIHRRLHT